MPWLTRRVVTPEQTALIGQRYLAGIPTAEIAQEFGIAKTNVFRHLEKAGIPRDREKNRIIPTGNGICQQCGEPFTYRLSKVKWQLERGIPRRFCSAKCRGAFFRGTDHPRWKPGATFIKGGYRWVYASGERTKRQPEHVLIAARALGRALKKGEIVHHINGDKLDNRSANLLICTSKYHAELHRRMSQLYQREKFGTPAGREAA